jgi:CheY-like chemotaxis protein/GAF domain-containing protein
MSDHRPRVLVLSGKGASRPDVLESLSRHFQIEVHEDVDSAIAALRREMFTAIFADVGDFLPLERALFDRQVNLVLNTIGEGVCIVDDTGVCVWANNKMRSFPPEVYERVKNTCLSAASIFTEQVSPFARGEKPRLRSKKFGFQVSKDRYFESIISPVIDESKHVRQVVAVVWDASSGRRLQQKIDAIDAAGRELVRLESDAIARMNVAERLRLLEEKIIRFTSDLMHFDHFCIRLLNKKTNKLELVISVGLPIEAMEVDLYAQPEGNGISGYVAATGRSYICHDVEKDPRYVLGLDHAKSSLTVPLRLHDKVIGVFNIESQSPGGFNEDDRQFAEIFGRYIAMALNTLDLLVVERYTTTGRLAENVGREIAAPLNDIVTEAQSLMEQYIGDDDMRQRLGRIVDNVSTIRRTVRHVGDAPKTVLGSQDQVSDRVDPYIGGKRIMVADDEPNIRQTITDVLIRVGAEVVACADGYQAVTALDQQVFDLVVSDIKLPHRNGYEIFAAARRRDATVPVILMTGFGYDPHHSIVRASQEGLQAVLFKPFKIDQFMSEVRQSLGGPDESESASVEQGEGAPSADGNESSDEKFEAGETGAADSSDGSQ